MGKERQEQHQANRLRKKKEIVKKKERKERKTTHSAKLTEPLCRQINKQNPNGGMTERQQLLSLSCTKKFQFHTLTPYATEKTDKLVH